VFLFSCLGVVISLLLLPLYLYDFFHPYYERLPVTLDVTVDLRELLLEALAALLRDGELRAVRRIVTSHDVDRGVEGGEGRLARHVVETTVVGDEVRHLGLDRLGDVLVVGRVAVHEGGVSGEVRGGWGGR
jgi:hypothetical protein